MMPAWIDEERIRFEDYDSREEADDEPMSEEEYRSVPRCAWCNDPGCPGAASHYDDGDNV